MFRRGAHEPRAHLRRLALLVAGTLTIAACSSDDEGVQLPDGSDAIIVDEVTALSASLAGHWGTGRAVQAVPVDENRNAVVTTTGVYLADADGTTTNLDLFGQTTDIGKAAVSDDGSTLAVAMLWPSVVRWYDLDGQRFVGLMELEPSTALIEFGFLAGTTNLLAVTTSGVTMWPGGPAGGAASPLADELPAGQATFFDDRLAVPLLNSNEVAIISEDSVDRLGVDVPDGAALLATSSSPDDSTLAVGYGTLESGDNVAVFDTNSFERLGTFAVDSAIRQDAWAVTDATVAVTDGAAVTMWSHGGEPLGTRDAPTEQATQSLLAHGGGVVSVHIGGAVADYPDDGTTPGRLVTEGGVALQDVVVEEEFDQLTSVDFYGRISSLDLSASDGGVYDDRFAAGESTGVAISGDASTVAVSSTNGRVAVLDPALNETSAIAVRGRPVRIDDVKFNPADNLLSTGLAERLSALAFDDTVTTWDPGNGDGVFSVGGESEDVPDCGFFYNRVEFTQDGSTMASTSHDFTVALIDATSGEVAHRFEPFSSTVLDVAFSHDDELLVATVDPGTVTVWNVADRSVEAEYEAPLGGYRAMAMLPNSDVMATVDSSGTLRLIEILTGRTMLTFDETSAPTTSIALSPDGSMLAAPDDDSAVSIWSTDSGLRLATLTGHAGTVSDLTFTTDGASLLTSSVDGTVRRWELDITT